LHDKPTLQGKMRKLRGPIAEASDLLGQVRIGRTDPSTWAPPSWITEGYSPSDDPQNKVI